MAISIGNTTTSQGMGSEANTFGYSHNHDAGTDDLLVAVAHWFRAQTPTSVTYNGVPMTQVVYNNSTNDAAIYRLLSPSSGANTLTWNFSGNVAGCFASVSMHGVDQTTPTGATNTATGTSNSPSTSLTTTQANSYIVDSLYRNNNNTSTAGASQTEFHDTIDSAYGTEGGVASYRATTTTGSYAMSWSWSSSTGWVHALAEILEASSGTAYSITATVASFVLTGIATAVTAQRSITGAVGTFTLTGIDIAFALGKGLVAETGAFVLTGINATLNASISMIASAGSFTLTGVATTLTWTRRIVAETGSFVLTGWSATLRSSKLWFSTATKTVVSWVNQNKS